MKIYCGKNEKYYGIVGTKATFTDDNGNSLSVGDIVLANVGDWSRLRFVCELDGNFYIPGFYKCYVGINEFNRDVKIKKIADFSEFQRGFKLNDLEFI